MQKYFKKICLIFLCVTCLNGCSTLDEKELYDNLNDVLFTLAQSDVIPDANMNKDFYNYYLPFDMKKITSSEDSEVFRCGNESLIMNFRTIHFIKSAYYSDIAEEEEIVTRYTEEQLSALANEHALNLTLGTSQELKSEVDTIDYTVNQNKIKKAMVFNGNYLANYGKHYTYTLSLRIEDSMCYLFLDGGIATFACYVPLVECEDMVYRMFYILKSMEYDTTEIIKDYKLLYSLKQTEENTEEENTYLGEIPDQGYLEDLLQRLEE